MIKQLILPMVLVTSTAAIAQTPGSFVGTSTNPNAPPLSAASLNAAFGTKADAVNGVLTNPTINGGITDGSINVRSYAGIDPTGATSSLSAINTAAAAACASTPIKELFFPGGTYAFAANFSVPCSGLTMRATPGTVLLKPLSTNTGNPMLLSVSGKSNVLVYGLSFEGGGSAFNPGPTAQTVAQVFTASNVVFDHTTFQHTHGIALLFSTSISNSGVRDSYFTDIGNYWSKTNVATDRSQAVAFCCGTASASFGNFVLGNHFDAVGLDSISAGSQVDLRIADNHCVSTSAVGQPAAWIGNGCIYVSNSVRVLIEGNTVRGTSGNGIDTYFNVDLAIVGNISSANGGAGVLTAACVDCTVSGNIANDNWQTATSVFAGGFSIGGGVSDQTNANLTFTGNVAGNTAANPAGVPTQQWGIQYWTSTPSSSSVWVDQNNTFFGNVQGAFGQKLSQYSAPTATLGYVSQFGSAPNQGIAVAPTGTGALTTAAPDNTIAGGNARGTGAVDWCASFARASAAQVASGDRSGCLYGDRNIASGQFAGVGGTQNAAQGPGSLVIGTFGADRFRSSSIFSNGLFAALGDGQAAIHILRALTTTVTPKRLTSGFTPGDDPSGSNCINLPNVNFPANQQSIYQMGIRLVATDLTTPGNFLTFYEPMGTLYRSTTVGTTTYVPSGTATTTPVGTAGSIVMGADGTNACLSITWTAPNTHTWHVLAVAQAAEAF